MQAQIQPAFPTVFEVNQNQILAHEFEAERFARVEFAQVCSGEPFAFEHRIIHAQVYRMAEVGINTLSSRDLSNDRFLCDTLHVKFSFRLNLLQ